jgi:hypothetical protein
MWLFELNTGEGNGKVKKLVTGNALNPFRNADILSNASVNSESVPKTLDEKSSISSRATESKNNEFGRPINATQKLMEEADTRLEAYRKDMKDNFPGDPEGWLKSRIGFAEGLELPKK